MTKPEEIELEHKRAILAKLEEDLVNCELERATLKAELQTFQQIYYEAIGKLIGELDEIEAQIAEATARKNPTNKESGETAKKTRKRATESAQSYQSYREESKVSLPRKKFTPTKNLKKLFREVARRIHPDLASDESDHAIREDLMKRANEAYRDGDEEKLRLILEEYESRPESIEGDSIGAVLVRVIRSIDLISQRIKEIKGEIDVMITSDLFILKKKVDDFKLENKDLLREMADYLRLKIQRAKIELEEFAK